MPQPSSPSRSLASLVFTPDSKIDKDEIRSAFSKARSHYSRDVDIRLDCDATLGVLVGPPYLVHKAFQMILDEL
jgi:hypothetical protein